MMKIRAFNILYSITPEDMEGTDVSVREMANSLPSFLFLEVESEDDAAEAISERTGWRVEGFEIDVIN